MKKNYPYLQDCYYEDANGVTQKQNFLSTIDSFVNQKQYIKITLLDWSENPLKEIQGELSTGSLTKDGSSSVRRTCSLTAVVSAGEYDVEDADMDFSINKKVFVEVGIKNYSSEYVDYPILWFPQGVFYITSFSITSNVSSAISIQLTLKDKMCGLNGEIGGTFQATTILDEEDTQSASGAYVTQKVLVYDIIQELVHHFGGEDLNNIVIEDVPTRIKQVMKWSGDTPIYLIPQKQDGNYLWYKVVESKDETLNDSGAQFDGVIQVPNGTDAGYIYSDFTYTDELTANMGENVCTILDKIKSYLGNYEYYYDVFGVFHFREIKNYLNTTQASTLISDMDANDYLVDTTTGKTVYAFSDKTNLISISRTPQYSNLKNDFVVQGTRQATNSSISYDVRYHLAIDRKPKAGNSYYNLLTYTEPDTSLTKIAFPLTVESFSALPQPGNFNIIYRTKDTNSFYYWDDNVYKAVSGISYYPSADETVTASDTTTEQTTDESGATIATVRAGGYTTQDWRTELFLQGLLAKNNGTDAGYYYAKYETDYNYYLSQSDSWVKDVYDQRQRETVDTDFYFEELEAFWPQIYDLENQQWYGQQEDKDLQYSALTDGNYFLDFIEPETSGLGKYSVANIGRRMDTVSSDDVNCLFQPTIPDIVFLNADDDDIDSLRQECIIKGQPYTQVKGDMYYSFSTGGYKVGAFDQIKYELYLHTTFQDSLSITCLPAFYLEPNSRVSITDATTNTTGDYIISNITIPFGAGNSMTCSASKCLERF